MNRIGAKARFLTSTGLQNVVLPSVTQIQCWRTHSKKSDASRWDKENTLLFGAKQQMTATKRLPKKDSVRAPRKAQGKTVRQKFVNTVPDHSNRNVIAAVDDIEVTSVGNWFEEKQSSSDQTSMKFDDNVRVMSISKHSLQKKNKLGFDIPQILPVPPSTQKESRHKQSLSGPASSSLQSREDTCALGSDQPKETNFILKCPLLPCQSEEMLNLAAEFRSYVESFGLRTLPTVNTILSKTRSDLGNFFLQRWREKMTKELGVDGFKKHQEATIWQGVTLHACIQQYLSGVSVTDIQIQDNISGFWKSISSVLPDVTEVQALETGVSHPWLCYKGTFDCIAKHKDVLYVIDWKSSSKPKPLLDNLYDNPLQVAAYLGAINFNAEFSSKFGEIDQAAIVVAYSNGEAAHVHKIPPALCQHYWKEWCQRLHEYWTIMAADKSSLPKKKSV